MGDEASPRLLSICVRMDDGLVEVVGLYSSLHVGRIQVNVDEPIRIGQAKEVKVRTLTPSVLLPPMLYSSAWCHMAGRF